MSPLPLQQHSFTIFDVETTGLNPERGDRIIEIAGVRVEDGRIQEEKLFLSLVNPHMPIPAEAGYIHGITEVEVKKAPPIEEVLPQFLAFAGDSILVAHNAEFDRAFLEAEKEGCWGFIDIPECLCTLTLSRAVDAHAYRHTLEAVAERYGIPLPGRLHRAAADVHVTAQVFLALLTQGKISSLEELRKKAGIGVFA